MPPKQPPTEPPRELDDRSSIPAGYHIGLPGYAEDEIERSIEQPGRIDQAAAADWLKGRWRGDATCPVCRSNSWSIGEHAAELVELPVTEVATTKRQPGTTGGITGRAARQPGRYPVVVVTCLGCGNTLLFNAAVAGLLPRAPAHKPVSSSDEAGDGGR